MQVKAHLERKVSRQLAAIGKMVGSEAAKIAGGDPDEIIAAVLGYGSCLRDDVSPAEGLADFYVLTVDGAPVSSSFLARLGCRVAPPNVYYAECLHEGQTLRAKYAVLPLKQFETRVSSRTQNPYFWARFSQPCALIRIRADAYERVVEALASAVSTMLYASLSLADGKSDNQDVWLAGLEASYRTELRSEKASRGAAILDANPQWYEKTAADVLGPDLPATLDRLSDRDWARGRAAWSRRYFRGKLLSVARLLKAAFTFRGGADYLAWKIERHSGVPVELTRWQRHHPILASIWLVPKLYLKGAFR